VYANVDMSDVDLVPVGRGTAAVYSARRPGKDGPNEDSAGLVFLGDGDAVLVVADGAGGMRGGDQASSLAVEAVRERVQGACTDGLSLREGILNGFESANRQIQSLGLGAASTLAVVELHPGHMRAYHAGDSPVMLTGQRGKRKLLTIAHSPVGYAVESGLLEHEEAIHHEDRHMVSNMVGSPEMRVEMGAQARLAARDTILLATDGLFDNLHVDEIVEQVRKGRLDKVARELARKCRERMEAADASETPSKPDDLTFILYRRTVPTGPGRREERQNAGEEQ
jgi:serine/threonine protein phosphatase PrpC